MKKERPKIQLFVGPPASGKTMHVNSIVKHHESQGDKCTIYHVNFMKRILEAQFAVLLDKFNYEKLIAFEEVKQKMVWLLVSHLISSEFELALAWYDPTDWPQFIIVLDGEYIPSPDPFLQQAVEVIEFPLPGTEHLMIAPPC